MGTHSSIVTYAIQDKVTGEYRLYSELVEMLTIQWMAMKRESLEGKGRFIFINQTLIESDEIGSDFLRNFFHQSTEYP